MQANDISFWSPCKVFIEVSGKDATSFLHRLSTQDMGSVLVGEISETCFLNSKGKLVDVVYAKRVEENRWILMSAHAEPKVLLSWLEKYHFSEQLVLGILSQDNASLFDYPEITEEQRIVLGLPKAPNEINEEHNPLELGLNRSIAWNKGCYIGQEVVSRLDTYDKVSRSLVKLTCSREDFPRIQEASEVTSYIQEFRDNQVVALGIFKKTALTDGGFGITGSGAKVWVVSSAR